MGLLEIPISLLVLPRGADALGMLGADMTSAIASECLASL